MSKLCLYCKREKEDSEFSREHILPRAIGGNLNTNNPFSINDVCEKCNNLCGLFIDGPFVKSWFINNYRADVVKRYCNLTIQTVLPLIYFGEIQELQFDEKICEFWLGPTGDPIYHFHEPYPKDFDVPPMVGVPTTSYNKEIDYGFVFTFIRSNNPLWHPAIILSVINNFKRSKLFLGNVKNNLQPPFEEIPLELQDLYSKLCLMQGQMHNNKLVIGINFADRFLCKLALGIGSIVLNPSFKESKSADLLREGMWTRKLTDRQKLPIMGSGFLNNQKGLENLGDILKWVGGHSLIIIKVSNKIVLYSSFYEFNSSVIQITDEKEHWEGKIQEGIVYLISPTLSKAIGPFRLSEFLAHRIGSDMINEEIRELEEEMQKFSILPPFDI